MEEVRRGPQATALSALLHVSRQQFCNKTALTTLPMIPQSPALRGSLLLGSGAQASDLIFSTFSENLLQHCRV